MLADFVRETTSTTGTGTIALTSLPGFGRLAQAFAVGDKVAYSLVSGNGDRENGIGTVGASNTLARLSPKTTLVGTTYSAAAPSAISLTGVSQVIVTPIQAVLEPPATRLFVYDTALRYYGSGTSTMILNTVLVDTRSEYNTTTNTFTATDTGNYLMGMSLYSYTNSGAARVVLLQSSAFPGGLIRVGLTLYGCFSGSTLFKLTAGDTVQPGFFVPDSLTTSDELTGNFFWVCKLP